MKEKYIYHMLRLLPGILLAAALWSCTHEELPDPAEEAGIPLTVQVTDAGFVPGTPDNGGPSTRMTEEGYKTIFTEGDTIGIYTRHGSSIADYNIPFVLTYENGKPVWKNPEGNPLRYNGKASRYYAYYPYRQQPEFNVPFISSDDPDLFFRPLIKRWSIPADQSTYEKYTAADLMVARGDFTTNPPREITFTFAHRMTLLEIDLSGLSDPSAVRFNNFTPYQPDPVVPVYRYIIQQALLSSLLGDVALKDPGLFYTAPNGEICDFQFTGARDEANRGKCLSYKLKEGNR